MIRILEKKVADKIAAGEVVDRPLSVVKELVENAIDAGATSIVCEIQKGGKTYIRVTDNGSGIPEKDVETAFLRHATSKISSAEDLDHIGTLGFRGEALASIAAVARVEMITRTEEEKTGVRLTIEGGEIIHKEALGCEEGTTIIVSDLFYNTPARLKFIKSDGAESTLIVDFISRMALAYPQIKMRMVNNQNILFSTRGDGDLRRSIMTVGASGSSEGLLPVEWHDADLHLTGYVSGPGETRATRRNQIYFVNGRAIQNKTLEKAVDAAYKKRVFDGRHPIIYLFLELSPEKLDVNIHPNKREVRFHDEGSIGEFVKEALASALTTRDALPQIQEKVVPPSEGKKLSPQPFRTEKSPLPETQVNVKQILSTFREENKKIAEKAAEFQRESLFSHLGKPFDFDQLSILGVIFDTYIMLQDEDTFYLVDQHAAHERIYFEKIMATYHREDAPRQEIMVPIVFDAHFHQDDWKDALKRFGFSVREFGPHSFAVHGIPIFMDISGAEKFLLDFVDAVHEGTDFESRDVILSIATRACKQAVKGGDVLSSQETELLRSEERRVGKECRSRWSPYH